MLLTEFVEFIFVYVFFYPLCMSYLWMFGAAIYYARYEFRKPGHDAPPVFADPPLVSILVPCFNEAERIGECIGQLSRLEYPNYEVLAINDGSSDNTGEVLERLAEQYSFMRVLHLASNQGKATGLNTGAVAARGQFIVCIDGDALLDRHAISWLMFHFLSSPRVGAVTGNPRVRTRSTLIGRIQVGEFSAIIGLLKRAQRIYGKLFTVSGVCSAFRKSALHRVGYWNPATQAEDIDVSWRLQIAHWDVRFEPRAICWTLMPETLKGLMRQRLRWAIGGGEAVKTYFRQVATWKCRRMWGIYVEYMMSVFWAYCMLFVILVWLLQPFFSFLSGLPSVPWIPGWQGVLLGFTCMLQFGVSMFFDRKYDFELFRSWLFTIWYPVAYWTINCGISIVAFPKAMFGKKSGHWHTLDRGIQHSRRTA
jgi:poly-beta-1,6 N-acetyl-D-glucosamine synthase